eukprot:753285-Hanusia_phi.AAC.5
MALYASLTEPRLPYRLPRVRPLCARLDMREGGAKMGGRAEEIGSDISPALLSGAISRSPASLVQ